MTTRQALANLMLVFIEGRASESKNPYTRPEIDAAFKALKIDKYGDTEDLRAIARGRRRAKKGRY